MKLLMFILIALSCYSCMVKSSDQGILKTKAVDSFQIINENDNLRSLQIYQINRLFPFGCEAFQHLPIEWETLWPYKGKEFNQSMYIIDSLSQEVYNCFHKINSSDTINLPIIKTFEVIKIGKYDFCSCGISKGNPLLEIKYRLPDLGKFQVYYSYKNIQYNYNTSQKDCLYRCLKYGNLILLDISTLHAKIIPIYFDARPKEPVSVYNRFFYITSYKNIAIWDTDLGELEGNIQAKHNIEISLNGGIKVEELFDYPTYKRKENQLKKNNK